MKFISVLSLFVLCIACDMKDPGPDDPRVQKMFQDKLLVKINEHRVTCYQNVVAQAEVAVDSTFRVMALSEKLGIFNPPDKPIKPTLPEVPIVQDTTPIKPLPRKLLDTLSNE